MVQNYLNYFFNIMALILSFKEPLWWEHQEWYIPSDEVIRNVHFRVKMALWDNFHSPTSYLNLSDEQKKKTFQILLLYVATSNYEFDLLWESLLSWGLVYMVYGKEIRFPKPYNSVSNYASLLEAVQFYEYKKTFLDKSKLH